MIAAAIVGAFAAGCGRSSLIVFDDAGDDDGLLALDPHADPIVEACPAIDYLFVIDNSASMSDNRKKLVASFPSFIHTVERSLDAAPSVHVGVVTTDVYQYNEPRCRTLGGLVMRTGGGDSSSMSCGPYAEGGGYMTEADDLHATFACAADVGLGGSGAEQPLTALAAAVGERMHRDGMCNEGYVRSDALMVVVVLTDEDEPYAAPIAAQELVKAKAGFRDNIVFVAITDEPDLDDPERDGYHTEVAAFAATFEHGFVASIRDSGYAEIFSRAVDNIVDACGG